MPANQYNVTYPIGECYSYFPTWYDVTTPTTTTTTTRPTPKTIGFDDVVITGVSGRFQDSENVELFSRKLYGEDLLQKERLSNFGEFDHEFFGITTGEVQRMDIHLRSLLEATYESIFDAGFNPLEFKGTKTGVFIGTTGGMPTGGVYGTKVYPSGFPYATEVARFFQFIGPTNTIDTTYSSGLVALDSAIGAIRNGICEQAIVAGINIIPSTLERYQDLEYVYNGSIGVVFLQKRGLSRRYYATVVNTKSTVTPMTGEKESTFAYTNGEQFYKLLREIYNESNIDPSLVTYLEAHGINGERVFNENEYKLIVDIFGKNRNVPLFVGSTKPTSGYEHGIISLVKMLIATQRGVIPATLKFQPPTWDGRREMKFITENTLFNGGLMALNSFGYRGTSVHIVLQPNTKQAMKTTYGDNLLWNQDLSEYSKLPRLFHYSARTEEGLVKVLDEMHTNPTDLPTHVLLHGNTTTTTPITHPYRGFTILNSTSRKIREIKRIYGEQQQQEQRPLWFLFNGLGTQWTGMGKELMQIEYFSTCINKIADILKPFGYDLMTYLACEEGQRQYVADHPYNSTILITAIQVAFVDLMRHLQIKPDGIVGYSFGEFVAAYADNALTLEETILSAYYLAKLIKEMNIPEGSMAKVGLSWEELVKQCPKSIVPTFNETKDTVIVSGPTQAIQQFVQQLKMRGIYATEMESYGLGLHSYLMKPIVSQYRQKLESLIRQPKLRSSKWFTTIESQFIGGDLYKYASPEYFVNSLVNPVNLYQTIQNIPTNAVTIEFGPSTYYQPLLTRTLGDKYTYINFMRRDAPNHLEHLWTNFGRLYNEGYNFDTMKLVLPVTNGQQIYPVPHTTKFLSPLVSWTRSCGKTYMPSYEQFQYKPTFNMQPYGTVPQQQQQQQQFFTVVNGEYKFYMDLTNPQSEYYYLSGYQHNGEYLYPTSGLLFLVWNTLAHMRQVQYQQLPIVFEGLTFHQYYMEIPTPLTGQYMTVRFVDQQTGRFEIVWNNKIVASGFARVPQEQSIIGWQGAHQSEWLRKPRTELLEQEDIYEDLKHRGFQYTNIFKGIRRSNVDGTRGELFWQGKWIPFLESMIQMNIFGKTGVQMPTHIQSIRIDPRMQGRYLNSIDENNNGSRVYFVEPTIEFPSVEQTGTLPFSYDPYTQTYICGGVEMSDVFTTQYFDNCKQDQKMVVERVSFVPYDETFSEIVPSIMEENEYKPNFHYYESYINQVRHYIGEILKKIESYTNDVYSTTSSTSSYDSVTSSYSSTIRTYPTKPVIAGKMVEGKFLNLLKEIHGIEGTETQYLNKVKQFLGNNVSFYQAWNEDPVFHFSGARYENLRTILDTVFENTVIGRQQQPTLKVLEIAPLFHSFGYKLNEFLGKYPTVKVDYHYVEIGESKPDFFNQWVSKSPFTVKKIDWNLRTEEFPTQFFNDYDLVILNGCFYELPFFQDSSMVKKWCDEISKQLVKPQGFFLTSEFNYVEMFNQLGHFENLIFNDQYKPYKYQRGENRGCYLQDIFSQISIKNSGFASFQLYRKPYVPSCYGSKYTQPGSIYEITINEKNNNWLQQVKEAMTNPTYERIWIICDNSYTGITGLVNCLRHELGGERIRCVFLSEPFTNSTKSWRAYFDELKRSDLVMNVFKYGTWGAFRNMFDLHEWEQELYSGNNTQFACVDWLKRGDINTLRWITAPTPVIRDVNQLLINVNYAGLNNRDILIATGKVHPETLPTFNQHYNHFFGMEFSGYAKDKRYMGITSGRGLSTVVVGDKRYTWEVPSQWTMEEASTVPMCYAQAYYALVVRGGLESGESVLIYNGATPFGQAAISIALGLNCKVFTTITSNVERDYLMQLYQGRLFEESFVYMNDEYFDRQIMRYTQGKGVNVVVSWSTEEHYLPSLRCLTPYGRFLELNDYLPVNHYNGKPRFTSNVTFHNIFFDSLFDVNNKEWSKVYTLIQEGIRTGIVRPLKSKIFEHDLIQHAFNHCINEKPMNKVVIKVSEPTTTLVRDVQPVNRKVLPKMWFSEYTSYIIVGGLTTFGLELALWMAQRGARKLVLTTPTIATLTPYQQRKLHVLQVTYGVIVTISHYHAQDEGECILLIKEAIELSEDKKIGGVFYVEPTTTNGDVLCEQTLTTDSFENVMNIKYKGVYNLNKYLPQTDSLFVVFSSLVSVRGHPGSGVYGYVNSAIERLCEQRRVEGKQAIVIQLGPISEAKSVFETPEYQTIIKGTEPQYTYETLNTLEHILMCGEYHNNTTWTCYVPTRPEIQFNERPVCEYQTPVNGPLFSEVFRLLGYVEKTMYDVPLVHCGLNTFLAAHLKTYLETMYKIHLTVGEIQQLTINKIFTIEQEHQRFVCPNTHETQINYRGVPKRTVGEYTTYNTYPVGTTYPGESYNMRPLSYTSNPESYTGNPETYTVNTLNTVYNTPYGGEYKQMRFPEIPRQAYPEVTPYQFPTTTTTTTTPTYPFPTYSLPTPTKRVNCLMPRNLFEKLNEVELAPRMCPLIVLHPIEGHVSMLKSWAKHMKYPVFGIQYTNEALQYDSIEKLADFYLRKIDNEFGSDARFHLIGYSFGGSVAFEMALKNSGRIQSLAFLDGSYMYVNPTINTFKTQYLSKQAALNESEFLYGFVSQYTQIPSRGQFVQELLQLTTFDARIKYAINYLVKQVSTFNFDLFDLEQAARAYVQRMFMSYKYQPKSVLKYNEILLVKPTQKNDYSEIFGEDYGLGSWIQGKIKMQLIDGDQRTFMESMNGQKIATILNEYLSRYYF